MSITAVICDKKSKLLTDCIYLDNAATALPDRRVLDVIHSVLADNLLGNPHAMHHAYGSAAAQIVQTAREQVAASISAKPNEIIFTSGATEANNLVIKGLATYLESLGKTHIITGAVEHKSILEPLAYLKDQGFDITVLPVKPCGMIEAEMIERALNDNTGLVSIQAVNNETGTIQPLTEIASILASYGILFHSDAVQSLGKVPFSAAVGMDFASFCAHKVYGPQGIGALYIKANKMELLEPLHYGGGQESGLRCGTLPVALCAGFGAACALIEDNRQYLQELRSNFLNCIAELKPIIYGHYDPDWNAPGILNIRFPGIDNETLVMALPGLAFGIGSACDSTGMKVSHVIKAITGSDQAARESIRLSFGHYTTKEEMNIAADQIITAVTDIRKIQGVI